MREKMINCLIKKLPFLYIFSVSEGKRGLYITKSPEHGFHDYDFN